MGCYVMVGLASRRILLHPTTDHMVAQVFRLQQPHGGETSIRVTACFAFHEAEEGVTRAHMNASPSLNVTLLLLLISPVDTFMGEGVGGGVHHSRYGKWLQIKCSGGSNYCKKDVNVL